MPVDPITSARVVPVASTDPPWPKLGNFIAKHLRQPNDKSFDRSHYLSSTNTRLCDESYRNENGMNDASVKSPNKFRDPHKEGGDPCRPDHTTRPTVPYESPGTQG